MPTIKRILCPTDFSIQSATALTYALRLAEGLGANITVLHVSPMANYVVLGDTFAPLVDDTALLMKSARHELDHWLEKYSKEALYEMDALLLQGDAYKQINAAAESRDANLIVMGTHGRSGLSRLMLGSVAERVVRTSKRPVLTIPAAMTDTEPPAKPSARA